MTRCPACRERIVKSRVEGGALLKTRGVFFDADGTLRMRCPNRKCDAVLPVPSAARLGIRRAS